MDARLSEMNLPSTTKFSSEPFSSRLEKAMARAGIPNQLDLAKRLGISQGTVSGWMHGAIPQNRMLRSLASVLNVTEEWLRGGMGEMKLANETASAGMVKESPTVYGARSNAQIESQAPAFRNVPVVSWAAAGAAKDYQDLADFLDEKVVTECKDPNAFGIIVDGDSMEPAVCAGDRVVVSPNSEAQSGDLVIARTRHDHGVFFKKYLRHGPRGELVRLISNNPQYPPMEFKRSDFRFIYPIVNLVRIYKRNS